MKNSIHVIITLSTVWSKLSEQWYCIHNFVCAVNINGKELVKTIDDVDVNETEQENAQIVSEELWQLLQLKGFDISEDTQIIFLNKPPKKMI